MLTIGLPIFFPTVEFGSNVRSVMTQTSLLWSLDISTKTYFDMPTSKCKVPWVSFKESGDHYEYFIKAKV